VPIFFRISDLHLPTTNWRRTRATPTTTTEPTRTTATSSWRTGRNRRTERFVNRRRSRRQKRLPTRKRWTLIRRQDFRSCPILPGYSLFTFNFFLFRHKDSISNKLMISFEMKVHTVKPALTTTCGFFSDSPTSSSLVVVCSPCYRYNS